MKTHIRHVLFVASFFMVLFGNAQITPVSTLTPTDLVTNYLVGSGVTVSGVTFNGIPGTTLNPQIGFFSGTSSVGIDSGIVISSGNIMSITGPNNSGSTTTAYSVFSADPDLNAISTAGVFDHGILEFDFVPTGDSVKFNYVFASEEYLEFVLSGVNDAFGIFLSGPGISGIYSLGAENIATLPGGTPISIDNVNNIINPAYYVVNGDGVTAPYSTNPFYIEYDGLTVKLTAKWAVSCGSTYHIKFAIADGGDGSWDSGVFIEAGSFTSTGSQVSADINPVFGAGPNSVFEGCLLGDTVSLVFTRPITTSTDTVNFVLSGDAINGLDYTLISPSYVIFPAGEDSVTLSFGVPDDGIIEGVDTLIITIPSTGSGCGASSGNTIEIYIYDPYNLNVFAGNDTVYNCPGQTLVFNGITLNGNPPYDYTWSDGTTGATINYTITALGGDTLVLSVTDGCGYDGVDTLIMTQVTPTDPLVANAGPDVYYTCPGDTSLVFGVATGGVAPYTYLWEGSVPGPSYYYVASSDTVVLLTVTDFCGNTDTDTLYAIQDTLIPLTANAGPDQVVSCVGETLTLTGSFLGGSGFPGFYWSTSETTLSIDVQPLITTNYVFTVFNTCGQVASDTVTITVPPYTPLSLVVSDSVVTVNCPGTPYNLVGYASGGGTAPYNYSWSNGDTDSLTSIVAMAGDSIVFTVTDACGLDSSLQIPINVLGGNVDLDFPDLRYCKQADSTALVPLTVTGGIAPYTFSWSAQPGGTAYSADSIAMVYTIFNPTDGIYNLTITDACGASDTDSGLVLMKDCDLLIPNVMTPNGDGVNDVFYIDGLASHPNSILTVYNRWGVVVYYDTNYLNNWNGSGLGAGVYFYILQLTDGTAPSEYHGFLHLFY